MCLVPLSVQNILRLISQQKKVYTTFIPQKPAVAATQAPTTQQALRLKTFTNI
jgi:hypothetical protein